jgi:large repetitive protein
MKHISSTLSAAFIFLCGIFATAQTPNTICPINAGPPQSVCAPNCATLTGTYVPTYATTSYTAQAITYAPDPFNAGTAVTLFDDQWSPVINIGFTFCFYGNPYTQLCIGSNGVLTFDLVNANGYCQWPIGAAVPTTSDPVNSIMGPWQDLYPPGGGQIRYATYGSAPCRRFVVSWYQVPMYACTSTLCTQQLVLYETTNIIDNFLQTKPLCASWNGGYAIEAIQNAAGTNAVVQAGRNYPTQWNAVNDGRRWMPNGASTTAVSWYQGATLISSTVNAAAGTVTAVVCPIVTTTYTLQQTVTNCNATNVTVTSTMTVTASSLTLSGSQTNINCFGTCNGTASVTVVAGTGPFTYLWSPAPGAGQGTANATGLCAGTYTCTVTGAGGCQGTQTYTITQPPQITATQSQVNVTCFGSCNGTASVVAAGGNGTYTYTWAPAPGGGQGTANATGLCPGTYTCTICSPAGCCITKTFTITQPPAITALQSQVNVTCNGQCNGTASVVAAGGNGTYTYNWSPAPGGGQGTANATGLCAGSYTCTISSPAGCSINVSFTITQPPAITATQSQVNITCFGSCNGTASVVASGGTGTYTYSWAPAPGGGQGTANATGLCAGSYVCTISSPAGCSINVSFTITQPPQITATQSQVNVLCNGACTGTASVVASGGTGIYTYSWAPAPGGGQGTANATGLCAGAYVCTISSPAGCSVNVSFTITQPPAITATQSQVNVTCNGQCNGTASVVASGGNGTYTYTWAPAPGGGQGTANATGLCAGSYTCTICSPAGCCITKTFTITQPPVITATQSQVNVTCFGSCNGTASVVASGGTGTYTYNWAPAPGGGQGTANATGLCAGTYTCTVSSPAGCSINVSFTITQPAAITATQSQVNVTCNGSCNGSATVGASGGTGTYTYSWAPAPGGGQGTANATGLCAGAYVCTISSPAGCTLNVSFTITQPPAITATQSQVNVLCNGSCTGTASVVASGGTGTYTYNWSPAPGGGQGTANATGLCAGSYTCAISSPAGCSTNVSFTITQPPALSSTTTTIQATCGNPNGSATVTVTGGQGPYTYSWAPTGGTGPTAIGLAAGSYTCTITDANGCTRTATVSITNLGSPTAVITASTNITCFGGNNGSATVTASGGAGGYTYSWAPSGGTGSTASGLTATTYTVTVTDANGCQAIATVTLTQPPVLTATSSQVNVNCNAACNGSATVVAAGGTGTYTYSWAPAGGTGATASSLCAGSYTCTITTAPGCFITQTFSITQPPALTASQSQVNVNCNAACNGSATVVAAGGSGSYTYSWAPSGGTGSTASALCAGTYTCTIADASAPGCTITRTFSITQPAAITGTATITNATCGNPNGSATVTVTGGTGSYSYLWAPSGGTGSSASGLSAGSYSVTVTDANGCTGTVIANVTNGGTPTATIVAFTNILCFGGTNGSATVSVTGGTLPYTYSWTPSGGTGTTASGLGAGTYNVTVTDAVGCIGVASVTLTQPPQLTATVSSSPVLCNGGSTGSATVTATGGVPGYTYSWSPTGGTGSSATGLSAISYTCTVTDVNGCTTTASTTVTQPPALTATTAQTNVLCNGGATGSATVTPAGGVGGYTYNWAPSGGSGASAINLTIGGYTCTITDANGCTTTASVNITQPPVISLSISAVQSTCGNPNGSATVVAGGGVGGFTYLWSPSGGAGATATGLLSGNYSVLVTDANGCTSTATVNVPNAGSPVITITGSTNVSCFNGSNGTITTNTTGGTPIYTYSWSPSGGSGANASGLIAGTYIVTVTDANGCQATASATITQPTQLTASASSSPVLCFGGSTGSATVTASGGTPNYTYSWAPSGGPGSSAPNLAAGNYTCTITDANGCTATASTIVTQPTALTVSGSQVNELCNGGSTGSASVIAGGGTPIYTYSWTSGGTGATETNLIAGNYTCTVTDANGCTITQSFTITEPPPLSVSTSTTPSSCGSPNGSALATTTGGTGSCTFNWVPGNTTNASLTNVLAGLYSVTVVDANGCTAGATAIINNMASPTVTITSSTNILCNGGTTGAATANATGGTGSPTYSWSSGGSAATETGLSVGTYTVTATDANGCTDTAQVTLTEPPVLSLSTTQVDELCNGGTTGSATVSASGGVPGYQYNWSSGGTSATESSLPAGPVTVTVTDLNGCTATASVTINEPTLLTVTTTQVDELCFGGSTASATANPVGGTPFYNYSWSCGGTNQTTTGLLAGPCTVTVTDLNGCTATASVTITEPTQVTVNPTATAANCNQSDGSVSTTASGGTGIYAYNWSPGGPGQTINNIPTGTYSVTVTDANGCTATGSAFVGNLNGVNASLSSVTNILCNGQSTGEIFIAYAGGSPTYTFSWTPNVSSTDSAVGLAAGSYTVLVTDSNGCTSTVTSVVTEPTLLTISASAAPSSVCTGTQVQLSSTPSGGTAGYSVIWDPGQLPGNNQTFTPSVSGTYTATVTDANGCTANTTVNVTVFPVPTPAFFGDILVGCAPVCVNFSDASTISSPGLITGWDWDFGDGNTSTTQSPSHCYQNAGIYTVILTVTTADGCQNTVTVVNYVEVYANPVAAFTATPEMTTLISPEIAFTDSSTNASSWYWSFGDLNSNGTSTLQNPTYEYGQVGCYQALLTVTSPDGCQDTVSHVVCVEPDVSIYVPNAFTPNEDGTNEIFLPITLGMDPDKFEMWIYDRWGNLIFYTDDINEGWNGKVQGGNEIAQIDTYVWKINAKDLTGISHNLIGHVNLIK